MKKLKSFKLYILVVVILTTLNIGYINGTNTIKKKVNHTTQIKNKKLFQSVICAMNNNQIQVARDLVSTTTDKNELYNFIRNNKIQAARNYIRYMIISENFNFKL